MFSSIYIQDINIYLYIRKIIYNFLYARTMLAELMTKCKKNLCDVFNSSAHHWTKVMFPLI